MAVAAPRDYVGIAKEYARKALASKNRRRFGVWIRLAAQRFLDDLERAKKKDAPFTFDEWHAHDVCDFAEKLPHVEGKWDTPNITLHDSHVFFLVQLFGFRKPDGTRRFTTALFAIARKNAKALALDTPVPTPSGWTTMGDLAPGDVVFGADGRPCRVTEVSPVYVNHDCYRLRFSNDEEVVADAGHRWLTTAHVDQPGGVRTGNGQARTRVRTTQEIAATLRHGARGDLNHSIAMPAALAGDDIALPVAPYTLGAWLGDGHTACARLTCDVEDSEILDGIRADGWPVRAKYRAAGKASTFVLSDGDRSQEARNRSLAAKLRQVGVLGDKHIPPAYLRASLAQRLALLQGLMDTDGTISKSGRVISFTGINERLVAGVAELLASFGIKYSWRRDPLVCNGRPVPGIGHKLQFMAFRDELPVFRLRRKLDRMLLRTECSIAPRSRTVQIVAVERVPSVPVRCIAVDSPGHLFLFGRTMLPTHNSTLAAIIGLYCQVCEGENGPQVITAATTGQQARIVFNTAKRMVEKTPDLREAFGLEAMANAIPSYHNGGTLKPINAKASTQDGLNPSCSILDELHAHKNHDLLNVIKSAAGGRKNPLYLYLTTEGYANPGPWEEEREFAKKVLRGLIEADHYLALYFAVDEKDEDLGTEADDDFDEEAWHKANPLIEVNPALLTEIRKAAIEAKEKPGTHAEFKIKRLNRPSSVARGWVNLTKWRECRGEVDLDWLRAYPCHGGLDLSSTTDLTSFRLVWDVEGTIYTHGWRYVPRQAVRRREARGLIPYAGWVLKGYLIEAGDEAIDYRPIEDQIIWARENLNLVSVGYDGWNAAQVVQRLKGAGVTMEQFIQGPKSYHPAMQALEIAYLNGRLAHGNDPVLNWNASNLVARQDANLNNAPDKKRASEKIDDMCALLMGIGRLQTAAPKKGLVLATAG